MKILKFSPDQKPVQLQELPELPETGYLWVDFEREESSDWADFVREKLGLSIYDQHVTDSLNVHHPSFFETTPDYDTLVFLGLTSQSHAGDLSYHPTSFFLFPRVLITVRSQTSTSVERVRGLLLAGKRRIPQRPVGLLHMILSTMVDRFLALREPLTQQVETWQEHLLDPNNPFDDWMALIQQKSRLRKLEQLCESQLDTIITFCDDSHVEIDDSLSVRFNDLKEHIRRVQTQAQHLGADLESLVQIHFSAVAHRTNDIMRVLTVLTAIFLPLTFVAGIFGMNFENMPELKLPYAYFVVLALMALCAIGLTLFFRRKNWL